MGCGQHKNLIQQQTEERQELKDQLKQMQIHILDLQSKLNQMEQDGTTSKRNLNNYTQDKFDVMKYRRGQKIEFQKVKEDLDSFVPRNQENSMQSVMTTYSNVSKLRGKRSMRPKLMARFYPASTKSPKHRLKSTTSLFPGQFISKGETFMTQSIEEGKIQETNSVSPMTLCENKPSSSPPVNSGLTTKAVSNLTAKAVSKLNLSPILLNPPTSDLASITQTSLRASMTPIIELPSAPKIQKQKFCFNMENKKSEKRKVNPSFMKPSTNDVTLDNNFETQSFFTEDVTFIQNDMEREKSIFDLVNKIRQDPKIGVKMVEEYDFGESKEIYQEDIDLAKDFLNNLDSLPPLSWSEDLYYVIKEKLDEFNTITELPQKEATPNDYLPLGVSRDLLRRLEEKNSYLRSEESCAEIVLQPEYLHDPESLIIFLLLNLESQDKKNRKILMSDGFKNMSLGILNSTKKLCIIIGFCGEFVDENTKYESLYRKKYFMESAPKLIKDSTKIRMYTIDEYIYGDSVVKKTDCDYLMKDNSTKSVIFVEKMILSDPNDKGKVVKIIK